MDTSVLIWIIVGIIVVALIVVGVVYFMRGRTEQRRRAEHDKAEKLRAQARESELAARRKVLPLRARPADGGGKHRQE